MALKPGRVGVHPTEVDLLGFIKLYIPRPAVADAGKVLTVGSDGKLKWSALPTTNKTKKK